MLCKIELGVDVQCKWKALSSSQLPRHRVALAAVAIPTESHDKLLEIG